MDASVIARLSGLNNVKPLNSLATSEASKTGILTNAGSFAGVQDGSKPAGSFDSLLQSAVDMIKETNQYTNAAAEAEMSYAMGITNNTHELQAAQMKANISLQYTVAVRNAVLEAYKEIMQLQF